MVLRVQQKQTILSVILSTRINFSVESGGLGITFLRVMEEN